MTLFRVVTLFLVLLGLTGCSRVQFAYGQLDWVIPRYVEEYVDLTETQRAALDDKVDGLLAWHCRTQLGAYAELLRSAGAAFQTGTMTRERLGAYAGQLEGRWRLIMERASPAVADLILTASHEQVEELFRSFDEKNETLRAELDDETDAERRERYRERMTEELERWFGPLRPAQQQAVRAWSLRLTPLGLEGLRSRRAWQARLRDVIEGRADEAAFRVGIDRLLVDPRSLRSPDIQSRFDESRALALDLIHEIGARLDDEQRDHLARQTASYARDLNELSCVPDASGEGAPPGKAKNSSPGEDVRTDP